jgi:hypothetical protein
MFVERAENLQEKIASQNETLKEQQNISMRFVEKTPVTYLEGSSVSFRLNQNKHDKNECRHNLVSVTHKLSITTNCNSS